MPRRAAFIFSIGEKFGLGILRGDLELKIFDGAMQVLPNQAMRMEYSWLGRWLVRRGLEVGVEQAVADLKRYIKASELPYLLTFALSGIEVEEHCDSRSKG